MPKQDKTMINSISGFRARIVIPFISFVLLMSLPVKADFGAVESFQSALDKFQKEYGFPGATAAYVLPDGEMGFAATGFADLETGAPMTSQTRMLSASIGKTFVGAVSTALAREGVLDLDAPISKWLGNRPWFTRLPNHEALTLRRLLTHRSGLPDHVYSDGFAAAVARRLDEKDNPFPPEALIEFISDVPPLFEAGKGWAYSDTGYILIGLVIESAIGKSYYDEIGERFLTPLGLKLTSPADRRFLPGLAAGYTKSDNAFGFPRKTTTDKGMLAWHPGLEWTGGGMVSNSCDLARWGAALFRGNAVSRDCLEDLLDAAPISPETPDIGYGAGVAVYHSGPFGPVYGHGGWIPGYCSSLRHYPDHGVTIAFQINTDVGITDSPVISEMEIRLAKVIIDSLPK